jgi:hypothetical protein
LYEAKERIKELESKLLVAQEQSELVGRLQQRISELETQAQGNKAKGSPGELPQPSVVKPQALALAELYREEGLSLTQIAERLNAEGIPTLSGKGKWTKGGVDGLFRRYS